MSYGINILAVALRIKHQPHNKQTNEYCFHFTIQQPKIPKNTNEYCLHFTKQYDWVLRNKRHYFFKSWAEKNGFSDIWSLLQDCVFDIPLKLLNTTLCKYLWLTLLPECYCCFVPLQFFTFELYPTPWVPCIFPTSNWQDNDLALVGWGRYYANRVRVC